MDPKAQSREEPLGLGFDEEPPPLIDLIEAKNLDGLLELGAAYRSGTELVGKSPKDALECFQAAAELGSEDGAYLSAIALLHGAGVSADLAGGAGFLRQAAQAGHLRAKVYLANLYELGIHYKADPEKADVWYRSVARAAGLESAPGSADQLVELAELGCARHCLELIADRTLDAKDRLFYLKKAKTHGYNLYLKHAKSAKEAEREALLEQEAEAEEQRKVGSAAGAGAEDSSAPAPSSADSDGESPEPSASSPSPKQGGKEWPLLGSRWTVGPGLLAALVALFFAALGTLAALLGVEGARVAVHWPAAFAPIASHPEVVGTCLLVGAGALPSAAVYRTQTLLGALTAGGTAGIAGYFAFESIPSLWNAYAQAGAAGLGVFLLVAVGLGFIGGTRFRVPTKRAVQVPDRSAERLLQNGSA